MKKSEHDYYSTIGNWSFSDINYKSKTLTNWIYKSEVQKHIKKNSKVLDLGTAAGEKVLKYYPECREILATDFSETMIKNANENLKVSGRKNITFRVMDNLNMDTPDDYFDLVTARHTVTSAKQIYKTLKKGGALIIRGVDKMDCWALKKMCGYGQGYKDIIPISQRDYESIIDAGFKDVELIPLHVVEYYKTEADLYELLLKVPILDDTSDGKFHEKKEIPFDKFKKYVSENKTKDGIKLIRRYYAIIAKK